MEVHLMTDMMSGVQNAEDSKPATGLDGLDEQLVAQLLSSAKASGLKLTGEGGMLQQLTKPQAHPSNRTRAVRTLNNAVVGDLRMCCSTSFGGLRDRVAVSYVPSNAVAHV